MSAANNGELLAKSEIYSVLCNYCRGLDRMDKSLAYSVWHQDGTALYDDTFDGSGHGFIDWVWESHATVERHAHQLAQSLIRVSGDTASSESYVTVVLWTKPNENGKQLEVMSRGRYLDQWSLRNGVWAIDHRRHLTDMQTITKIARGQLSAASTRDSSDPSFELLQAP